MGDNAMKADELMKKMHGLKYGWYDYKHDKIITPDDKEFGVMNYFENNCYVLKPEDVWKRKIGTCWEFTLLEYTELKKSYSEVYPVYFNLVKDKQMITHTFVVYKDELGVFRWFEYAWERFAGVNGPYSDYADASSTALECAKIRYNATDRHIRLLSKFKVEPLLKLDVITAEEFIYNAENSNRPDWLKEERSVKGK